jgi:hypothetical protein
MSDPQRYEPTPAISDEIADAWADVILSVHEALLKPPPVEPLNNPVLRDEPPTTEAATSAASTALGEGAEAASHEPEPEPTSCLI